MLPGITNTSVCRDQGDELIKSKLWVQEGEGERRSEGQGERKRKEKREIFRETHAFLKAAAATHLRPTVCTISSISALTNMIFQKN